ncbi:MAG: LamG-like jellyroll fold domain-containing protein [Rickettsiales bacterium]|nr:LamG-like jellyroll fold domain-containing protein [Rickettsiales bacterium]
MLPKIIKRNSSAFSLIELSIVILIIGILIAGVTSGSALIKKFKISTARTLTESSPVNSIRDIAFWYETSQESNTISVTNNDSPSDADSINKWNDYSPASQLKINSTIQTSADNQPKYKQNAINGLPALSFDGNDFLEIPKNNFTQNFTLLAVIKTSVQGASSGGNPFRSANPIVGSATNECNSDIAPLSVGEGTLLIGASGGFGCPSTILRGTTNVSDDKPHIVVSSRNSGNGQLRLYVDGIDNGATGTTGNVVGALTSKTVARIGASDDGANFWTGYIAEVIVFEKLLTNDERKSIESYLSKKWAIQVSN